MAYTFQTFTVGQILTAAQMNQVEANIRDHVHGVSGVGDVFATAVVSGTTQTKGLAVTDVASFGTGFVTNTSALIGSSGTNLVPWHQNYSVQQIGKSLFINHRHTDDNVQYISFNSYINSGSGYTPVSSGIGFFIQFFKTAGTLAFYKANAAPAGSATTIVEALFIQSNGNIKVSRDLEVASTATAGGSQILTVANAVNKDFASVYLGASMTASGNATWTIPFDTVYNDPQGMLSVSSKALVIPVNGVYRVEVSAYWGLVNSGTAAEIEIIKTQGGGTSVVGRSQIFVSDNVAAGMSVISNIRSYGAGELVWATAQEFASNNNAWLSPSMTFMNITRIY